MVGCVKSHSVSYCSCVKSVAAVEVFGASKIGDDLESDFMGFLEPYLQLLLLVSSNLLP
jgi:hypothetical protein